VAFIRIVLGVVGHDSPRNGVCLCALSIYFSPPWGGLEKGGGVSFLMVIACHAGFVAGKKKKNQKKKKKKKKNRYTLAFANCLRRCGGAALVQREEDYILWLNNDFFIIEKKNRKARKDSPF